MHVKIKIQSYTTKNIIYLDVSTSTGSLHQKNENVISSSGSWHSNRMARTGWRNDVFIFLMKTSGGSRNAKVDYTFGRIWLNL